ncbi:MAG: hypothetical protein H7138_19045 [Myxococcales bacterium]|nr:hypothetical protein [Myxococcales bacterium]
MLAEIRALRSSIFKKSSEVQQALAVAASVEQRYDLTRNDLFLPVLDTFCAILDPLALTLLTGTLRRVGNEVFPALISVLGIPRANVKAEMGIKDGPDLVRAICGYYTQCVVGPESGALTPMVSDGGMTVTDTTVMPCQLQMGVFVGAGIMTGLFRDSALVEKRCRSKGDSACVYEFTFANSRAYA